jgi:hypothetical protein
MSEFSDQYKHPKWQKKRLEMLEAAQFECSSCGDKESQLHVHHKHYVKGRKVWDYESWEFAVLCDKCHKEAHEFIDALSETIVTADGGWIDYSQLIAFAHGLGSSMIGNDPLINLCLKMNAPEYTVGQICSGMHDYCLRDLITILSLDPDSFRALAQSVREKNVQG